MRTATLGSELASIDEPAYDVISAFAAALPRDPTPSNSHPSPRVLCFSRDPVLGKIRRWVLERRYDTVSAGDIHEIAVLASGPPFDVIVLCHTLFLNDRQRCLDIMRRVWPTAKVVSVLSESSDEHSASEQVVLGLAGPEALLNAVYKVLQPIHRLGLSFTAN